MLHLSHIPLESSTKLSWYRDQFLNWEDLENRSHPNRVVWDEKNNTHNIKVNKTQNRKIKIDQHEFHQKQNDQGGPNEYK